MVVTSHRRSTPRTIRSRTGRASIGIARALLAAALVGVLSVSGTVAVGPAAAQPQREFADTGALAGQCVTLTDPAGTAIGGESAPYSVQAAGLDTVLLHGSDGRVLTATAGGVGFAPTPRAAAIWEVAATGDGFRLSGEGQQLSDIDIRSAQGCHPYPEVSLNVRGDPPAGQQSGELRGFVDSHAHLLAAQFLGGELHCGAPYSPLGVADALTDCADHQPNGIPAVSEHILSRPGPHDTTGWPAFTDWPRWDSLTHEQTYYRWIERAWRGGVRMINNYYVQNRVLCENYPLRSQPCDEMESVRIQHRMLRGLQDYIDAQAGGPGRGFLRIVTTAAQARAAVAADKIAVTLGVEVSEPFGCRVIRGEPQCDEAAIDAGLDELNSLGIRQIILTHKFDNALGGTRFDEGTTGIAVNAGQVLSTGEAWQVEPCRTDQRDHEILGYPQGCNPRGLTALGEYAVNAMIDRQMIIDIDHMSVKMAARVLDIADERDYPGLASSHTWTDPANYERILARGGVAGLYATPAESEPGDEGRHGAMPTDFVSAWQVLRAQRDPRYYFGIGFGPDMGGLGAQAYPRPSAKSNPVRYPFLAADGVTLLDRQVSGQRVFDINTDGTAHYGLLPDWVESLRLAAGADGDALVADLYRAAEAYVRGLQRVEAHR